MSAGIHKKHSLRGKRRSAVLAGLVVHHGRVASVRGNRREGKLHIIGNSGSQLIQVSGCGALRQLRALLHALFQPVNKLRKCCAVLHVNVAEIPDLRLIADGLHKVHGARRLNEVFCFLGGQNLIRSRLGQCRKINALCLQLFTDSLIQVLQKSAVHGKTCVIRVDPDSDRSLLFPVRGRNHLSGRSPCRCASRGFLAKRQLRKVRKEALIAAERDACFLCIFFQLPGHLLVLKVQECLILRHNGVGQRHRVAFHVISADVEEPHDLVQLAADIGCDILLRHFPAKSLQLRLSGLTRVFFRIQKENRVLRKCGAVLPGISRKVLLRRNLHLLLVKKSGECLPLCLGDAAAVKGKPRILRHLCLQPLVKRRNAGLSHFHQGDAASCKLMLCLDKITSVCPERSFLSPHGENACGACKAAVVLSCLEAVCHIFRIVIIRGRNDHGVHTVSLHRTAKRRKTGDASVLCHFSLSFFPVFFPNLRSFLS